MIDTDAIQHGRVIATKMPFPEALGAAGDASFASVADSVNARLNRVLDAIAGVAPS